MTCLSDTLYKSIVKVLFMIREEAAALKDFLKNLAGNMSFLLHCSQMHQLYF